MNISRIATTLATIMAAGILTSSGAPAVAVVPDEAKPPATKIIQRMCSYHVKYRRVIRTTYIVGTAGIETVWMPIHDVTEWKVARVQNCSHTYYLPEIEIIL